MSNVGKVRSNIKITIPDKKRINKKKVTFQLLAQM